MKLQDLETNDLENLKFFLKNKVMPFDLLLSMFDEKLIIEITSRIIALDIELDMEINKRKFLDGSLLDEKEDSLLQQEM